MGTAPDADTAKFPLETPVLLRSNDAALLTAMGAAETLRDSVSGVSSALASTAAARVVVVRVSEGQDAQETIANITGTEAAGTGIWALLNAPEELGVTPRLIITPGYTSQTRNGLGEVTFTDGGSGGTDGIFDLAFTGGTGEGGAGTFTVTSGVVTSVTITNGGAYSVAPTLDFSASAGLMGTQRETYGGPWWHWCV